MNFEDLRDIKRCLNRGGVSIRDLYTLFELRQPVPEHTATAGAELVGVRQVPWLQDHVSLALDFTNCALEKEEFLLVCDVARETFRLWGRMLTTASAPNWSASGSTTPPHWPGLASRWRRGRSWIPM